ncbi:hemerythrin domain-containing protein [Parasalinivibrio latis]|uniref:hemerythrin domain-containing protein n=1 Tax=Parasalinivibrio latis TaxID=2952610 RepID=UPI0030DE884F
MLDLIHLEHKNISRLLALLERKLAAIQAEDEVDFRLIRDSVEYLGSYSEKYHHPKEDVIYLYYLEHYGDNGDIAKLDKEHEELSVLTQDFETTVDMILMDSVVPLSVFAEQLQQFIRRQRDHLMFEERDVLPIIAKAFNEKDWLNVRERCILEYDDPLFGKEVSVRFRRLSEKLFEPE